MLESLFDAIQSARTADLAKESQPYPKNNPTPSDLSACPRETALSILHWQERPAFSPGTRARLDVGIAVERKNLAALSLLGFDVVEQQKNIEYRHHETGSLLLRGKIDGKVAFPQIRRRPIIFDHKTVSPFLFPRLNTVEDLLRNRWYRKWVKQNQAYMLLENDDISFFFLDNNLGEWKFIECPLDLDLAESVLRQAEQAVAAVEAIRRGQDETQALPPYLNNFAECQNCWAANRVCFPPNLSTNPLEVMSDEDAAALDETIRRYLELGENVAEYNRIGKKIKPLFNQKTNVVVGSWFITGKERSRTMPPSPGGKQTWWEIDIQSLAGKE